MRSVAPTSQSRKMASTLRFTQLTCEDVPGSPSEVTRLNCLHEEGEAGYAMSRARHQQSGPVRLLQCRLKRGSSLTNVGHLLKFTNTDCQLKQWITERHVSNECGNKRLLLSRQKKERTVFTSRRRGSAPTTPDQSDCYGDN